MQPTVDVRDGADPQQDTQQKRGNRLHGL